MARETGSGSQIRSFTSSWLFGVSFILAAFFVLFLMLGWFATFELLAVAVGLAALSGIFVIYRLANPIQQWSLWVAYLLFSLGFVLGIGFLLDYDFAVVLACGVALLGLPFLWLYVDRVWLKSLTGYWWAGLTAGLLVTLGASLLHYRAGWPPNLLRGLIIFTFMGGISASAFMVWAPGWREERTRWLVLLTIVTGLIALVGILDAMDMEFLIPVALLMIGGGYFLIRGVLTQAQLERERARQRAAATTSMLPPGPPPAETSPQPFMRGLRESPSLPIPGRTALPEPDREATQRTVSDDTEPVTPPPAAALERTQPAPPPPVVVDLGQPIQIPGSTEARLTPTIVLTSPAFLEGDGIPTAYTSPQGSQSPPLAWEHIPPHTRSLALVVDTPDAPEGIRTHWLVCNLPPEVSSLPAGIAPESAPGDGQQLTNDFGIRGYSGPVGERAPGEPYRYFFKIYALDAPLDLAGPATRRDLNAAMRGHILATGQLMGVYPIRPPSLPD